MLSRKWHCTVLGGASLIAGCSAGRLSGDVAIDSAGVLDSVAGIDHDSDGYRDDDCDDEDPLVHPGAVETCDGVDDDCDGSIDEEAIDAVVWLLDDDDDDYGAEFGASVSDCDRPDGFVANGGDCDDQDETTWPGAPEVCGDGVDNDCVLGGSDDCRLHGTVDGDKALVAVSNPYGYSSSFPDTSALAAAPDVGGDGVDDLLVGWPEYPETDDFTGAVLVCDGPVNALASLDACAFLRGDTPYGLFGHAVTGIGDANADGYGEVFVGVPQAGFGYAYFGPVTSGMDVADADLVFTESISLGWSSAQGPVMDGEPTIAVSSPAVDTVYLLDANTGGDVVAGAGFPAVKAALRGEAFESTGSVIHDLGDTDGDGVSDLGIGTDPPGSEIAVVYVVTDVPDVTVDLEPTAVHFEAAVRFGPARDENGDGYADVLASWATARGVRLFLGPFLDDVDVSTPGTEAATMLFTTGGNLSLDPAGVDFDGDGLTDVALTAYLDDSPCGVVLQYAPASGTIAQDDIDLTVATTSNVTSALENIGDTDGDGHEDLVATGFDDLYVLMGQGI